MDAMRLEELMGDMLWRTYSGHVLQKEAGKRVSSKRLLCARTGRRDQSVKL